MTAQEVMIDADTGVAKLWLIAHILKLRKERPLDFSEQSRYHPLIAHGSKLGNLLAFRRGDNLIAIVPRFTLTVGGDWGDTRIPLPDGLWRNVFTSSVARLSLLPNDAFEYFPVALYLREAEGNAG